MSIISCIGSGNMGFALMSAASRIISAENIFFTDLEKEKAHNAAASIGANVLNSNIEAVEISDYIFLAVKPQILPQILEEISPVILKRINNGSKPILVSMAAGWSIKKIQSAITGIGVPVIRIMPNTPALIGKGVIALAVSSEVTQNNINELEELLSGTGIVDIINEHYMDAVTGLSGSGPAFVYLFIEALADGGVQAGLPRDKALLYATQTVTGAAAMVMETKKHPGELKDMVTSPGGTTIAGIAALENGSFRSTVMNAVQAAWKKSKELG